MPRERADVVASLATKGFKPKQGNRDHDFFFFKHPDLTLAIYTKVSRGSSHRTIGDGLLSRMSKQLKLTRSQFDELVDCTMDESGYVQALQAQGFLSDSS